MPYFVLAGVTQCPLFNHARYVSDYLSIHLPNFKITVLEKSTSEWQNWLKAVNLKNKWYHDQTLIVWKELIMRGGKPYLIGGLSEFWEYCYDYYGLETFLSDDELQKLNNDFKQYYTYEKKNTHNLSSKQKILCIIGEDIKMEALLIMQLLELNEIFKDGLIIRIYDQSNYDENMQAMFIEATEALQPKFIFAIEVVNDLENGLKDCELLIITGNITRKTNEEFYVWLKRNYLYMMQLSEQLNLHAENYLKILLAMHGPVCFNANVLQETLTKVHLYNIVAVTADLGLEVLNAVSALTNISIENLSAPPVWGFIGANQIIDIDQTIEKCNVYLPNSRAAKDISGTTLPLGKYICELRFLCYALHGRENIWSKIYNKKQLIFSETMERPRNFPKIRAIISLIKNWYSSNENGNIISLGIGSNGAFGIPQGIVFSQPVCMNNGKWVPAEAFPPPRKDPCILNDFMPFIYDILKLFKLRDEYE